MTNNRGLTLFGYNKRIESTGTLVDSDIYDTDKIKLVTENAGPTNEIKVYARLTGQSSWNLLDTLTGTSEIMTIVDTYHELKIDCTILDGSSVKLIGSGFNDDC